MAWIFSSELHAADCQSLRCPSGTSIYASDKSSDSSCYCKADPGAIPDGGGKCGQYVQLYEECVTQIADTAYTCDEKNNSGLNEVANTATELTLLFGQQSASSVHVACKKMAGISASANAAVAAYRMMCQSAIGSCHASCDALVGWVKDNLDCVQLSHNAISLSVAETQAERCTAFGDKAAQANQAINNFYGTMVSASKCADSTRGDPAPEVCKTNPSLPGCDKKEPVDCTKPELAGSKVCVCSKSPSDPICSNEKTASGGPLVGGTNPSSRAPEKGAGGPGGDLPGLPSIQQGKLASGGAGEAIDGKQGGGAGLSGFGSGGGTAGAGAGEDDEGSGHAVTAGFYGGGGSSTGSTGGGSGSEGYSRPAGQPNAKPGSQDLRQFLPGGKYDPKARGIAGSGGPDGITGPHSNIWKKIQNRYQVLTPTLIP
ncbi:hypothetical protein [Bdellovibrio bacteriovorus]|nr:hypothetical protein [Bdellovibrio bacteriovorus]